MNNYLNIVRQIFNDGQIKSNRTGTDTLAIVGTMFQHNMSDGFPILTTKGMGIKTIAAELEFFIKGLSDKKWLQDRNVHIWDEWCNPQIIKYDNDEATKKKMKEERDLGCIYGVQWRNFGAEYIDAWTPPISTGCDQLASIIHTLKTNPDDRRMIVSAWNPMDLDKMALPPCHYAFQITVINNKINLLWNQRSVDVALGLPFNISSYGMLLMLLAKETGFTPGKLIGFLGDTHIYVDHIEGLTTQLLRTKYELPTLEIVNFKSIFDWEYTDVKLINYKHHPKIDFTISV